MGSVVISGATSGAVTLAVPAEAGTRTITFPATTATVLTTDISAAGDTSSGDNAAVGYTSAEGLILTGQGSTSDVTIKNDADVTVMSIPTGTTQVAMGQINAASGSKIYTAGSGTYELDIAGALSLTSGRDNGASMLFNVSGSQRMSIDAAGRVIITSVVDSFRIGASSVGSVPVISESFDGSARWLRNSNDTSSTNGARHQTFFHGGAEKGSITTTSTATAYGSASDYRLKENVNYSWDATTRLKQLKPARFNFKVNADSEIVDGFIAHEVSSIVPEAVTGTKDGMRPEVLYVEGDELPDGKSVGDVKEASAPDYQGIDQSKLVPLLVKTIQELEARITALEA
jgi:hypothetical protein